MYVDGGELKKSFFKEGDIVFEEGDPGDVAYIVESGTVGIFKTINGEEIRLATIGAGELFGEMAIIDGSKRMAHALALEDCVVVNVPRSGLAAMLGKQPPMIRALIQILVDSLRNVHEVYVKRPRSLRDSVNAMAAGAGALRRYLDRNPDADPSGEARLRIREVAGHAAALDNLVSGWRDPRASIAAEGPPPAKRKRPRAAGEGA